MEKALEREIIAEAKIRLHKYEERLEYRRKYLERVKKRTGVGVSSPIVARPKIWNYHRQFDPAYCLSHARFLAKSIVKSVREGKYRPIKSYRFSFRKSSGDRRRVDVFGIPDSALASLLSEAMRSRNQKIFSSTSFAYMPSKTSLDAVFRLKQYLDSGKVYISKYDFSDYFGSIRTDFIEREVLESESFLITKFEEKVIRGYLDHEYEDQDGTTGVREIGIPQGNSISLFLANAVGHALDTELDKLSGNYIRYADDSVLVNYSYEDAVGAISAYREFSRETGVVVNQLKTTGISIFSTREEEMRTVKIVEFLGYSFSKDRITISDPGVERIKKRCAQIIYESLLLYPKRHSALNCKRLDGNKLDWDFVSCIHRLRSYINGPYTNEELKAFLDGKKRIKVLSGCVSYYCLSDTVSDFSRLDGWLVWAIERALVKRAKIIKQKCSKSNWDVLSKSEIISGSWFDRKKYEYEVSAPSFVLAWRASKKCWAQHGSLGVEKPGGDSGD
ncbi:reverse transcriptase domain-containing protein [Leisingera aquaemixtae]|uniref:Retron-type reverse transcriptase n=1 Tax=Leisingera aquaemixtae TaxID=1396826 RepID=A0A0N7M509_9RHOB|nr:reverse transcriptase domain-containing protein [Leisingera aquaemixtae]CUI01122.1 Retron-type reverse transcriptase [Leisingera aquaemixtae]